MKQISRLIIVTILGLVTFHAYSQPRSQVRTVNAEQQKFIAHLRTLTNDTLVAYSLARYFENEVARIHSGINSEKRVSNLEKEKSVRSLVFFIKELATFVSEGKINIYELPQLLQSYKTVSTALLQRKPVEPYLATLPHEHNQLLAASFSQYDEYRLMDDMAVYKRVATTPEFILQFLESKPGFRFTDTLILSAAANDPLRVVHYLNKSNKGVQDLIRKTNNRYLKEIVALSSDRSASEIVPLVTQIVKGTITRDEILEKRKDVKQYFQLLVDNMISSTATGQTSSIFLKPLRDGIHQKSLSFYVNEINNLHDAGDAVRFASVKDLRPEDLYYIIVSTGDDMYTSSYLGLYKRLIENFKKKQSADSVFEKVNFDQFRTFMRLAANYNVLGDFLHNMPKERMTAILSRFIANIETDSQSGLDKAMDIADSFSGMTDADVRDFVQSQLQANLDRSRNARNYYGIRLYNILQQVFELVKEGNGMEKVWSKLGNYETLSRKELMNDKGNIEQLVLFYGDEDGISSFANFLKMFSDNGKWSVTRNSSWVTITSKLEQQVTIYANLPLDMKEGKDIQAQDTLVDYILKNSAGPSILVHRGHSYHLEKTLRRLRPSVKLAILGSCGGYNKAISIASINEQVQVIGSKKIGAKSINEPILEEINEALLSGRDLNWPDIWGKLNNRFSKDAASLALFNEYFSPNKNLGLFVLKLFNYYNKPVGQFPVAINN